MGLLDLFRSSPKAKEETVLANGTVKDARDVEDPTAKFVTTRYVQTGNRVLKGNAQFYKPEYDLPTIANAIEMDGYLQRSVSIFEEQILKNGIEYVSKNEEVQTHIKRRLQEIEKLTGISTFETYGKIARQLVSYGNAYLIKVRSSIQSKYGSPYRLFGKNMNPIVGLFVADATTIQVGLNTQGQVVNYKQLIRGEEIFWDERDVIHFTYHKTPGTLTGMSSIIPILDDLRALRKLEEEVEILGFQYSIPLYLYKVGTKDIPAAPGEIDNVTSEINHMPSYGMLVVPGHHDITVPTNNNTPVDLLSFINHFKKRVFSGIGVSPVAMGEVDTSNRNTAATLDTSMQSVTVSYQRILKYKLELEFIRELLLDGGFEKEDEILEINFPEIDLENQIKKENHTIQKWTNNLITRTEARNEMDYEKAFGEEDTFLNKVAIPLIEAKGEVDAKNAAAKLSASKDMPSNQHGKQLSRPKVVKNYIDGVLDINGILLDNLIIGTELSSINKSKYLEKVSNSFIKNLNDHSEHVLDIYTKFYRTTSSASDLNIISSYINEAKLLLEDKIDKMTVKDSPNKIDVHIRNIKDFISLQEHKIENLIKILVYKSLGYKTILIDVDTCEKHTLSNVDVSSLSYHTIPPFQNGCSCTVDEKGLYEFNDA